MFKGHIADECGMPLTYARTTIENANFTITLHHYGGIGGANP